MNKTHKFYVLTQWYKESVESKFFKIVIYHKDIADWVNENNEQCSLITKFYRGDVFVSNSDVVQIPVDNFRFDFSSHIIIKDADLAIVFKLRFVGGKYDHE